MRSLGCSVGADVDPSGPASDDSVSVDDRDCVTEQRLVPDSARSSAAVSARWAGALPLAFTVILAPPANMAVECVGYRPVLLVSLAAATIGILTTSFMPKFPPIFASYSILCGIGSGTLGIVTVALVTEHFRTTNAIRAVALTQSGSSALSFPRFETFLIERFGWRITLRILAALLAVVGTPCVLCFPAPNSQDKKTLDERHTGLGEAMVQTANGEDKVDIKHEVEQTTGSSGKQFKTMASRWRQVLMYPEVYMISLGYLLQGVTDCFYYVNLVSYIVSIGYSIEVGSLALVIVGVSNLVGKLFMSLLGEFFPLPNIFLSMFGSLVGAAVMTCLLVVDNITIILALVSVAGGVLVPITSAVIYSIPHDFFRAESAPPVWSIIVCCNGIGYLLGSLAGQSIDRTGSYSAAILSFVVMYVISASLFAFAPLYQKYFAEDRFITFEIRRQKKLKRRRRTEYSKQTASADI
ncbi:monocarboxylate transporter 12-like [Diadema antillarum]|uniref:monocarboxylate transporter 12-like n=1 Tax=Diadema antillarum TaxID=105358 RepID=UPI003A881E27